MGRLSSALPLRLALLLGLGAALSGCISFRSVSIAASFGQLIGSRAGAVTAFPAFCAAENILAGAVPTCPADKVELYVQEVSVYSLRLSQYATTIRNLADFNDPRLADELGQVMLGLGRTGELIIAHDDQGSRQLASAAGKI